MAHSNLAPVAKAFKAMHVPGTPLLLANVYDTTSARIIASLPETRALATASFAVALANGVRDEDLTFEAHLAALAPIAAVAHAAGKPLTVDLQAGYGERLEEAVGAVIQLGVVGINLEDSDQQTAAMMEVGAAADRVRRAVRAAEEAGVPDFVVNARSDALFRGGSLEESVERGKRYLEAGATTVYILWPLDKDMLEEEVKWVVDALGGRVNLATRVVGAGGERLKVLTSQDLARLGAARVSVGPRLYFAAQKALKDTAAAVYGTAA